MKNPPLSGLRTDKNLNPCNPLRSPIESGRRPGSRRSRSHSSLGADRPGPPPLDGHAAGTADDVAPAGEMANRSACWEKKANALTGRWQNGWTARGPSSRVPRNYGSCDWLAPPTPRPPLANRPLALVSSRSAFWRPAAKRTPPHPLPTPPRRCRFGGGGRVL